MTRLVSLGVILGLVATFGLLSLRVMSSFLLPLLLAAMLVVIFGPLHRWLRDRLQAPEWVAAGLTTLFVLLIVLVPLSLLVARAGRDAVAVLRSPTGLRLDPTVLDKLVVSVNDATGFALTADSVNAAAAALALDFQPVSDLRASSSYRMRVAQNLLQRLWLETRTEQPLAAADLSVWQAVTFDAVVPGAAG